ncbi:MAG: AIPR family protein [Candidatus Hydrogenedentes bacterium]|nr:AIPR family protein [Candidatus Hydrogenedentota bacterium]
MPKPEQSKATFRQTLKTFVSNSGKIWEKLTDKERTELMTRFYVTEVYRPINAGMVSDDNEDLEPCYVDGSKDLCVDFISSLDGRVLIIQTKFKGEKIKQPESLEDFEYFCSTLARLRDQDGREFRKNAKLRDQLEDIDWEHNLFEMHYITLGRGTESIREREYRGQSPIKGLPNIEERVRFRFLDETDLNIELRQAEDRQSDIRTPVTLRLSKTGQEPAWITYETNQRNCYIGRISGKQLQHLYRKHRQKLFAMNIRNYVGDTSTNKQIKATAKSDADNFFFYNNGISAVATNITADPERDELVCERFSIINGAQTVTSIFDSYNNDPTREAERTEVLLRVSEISLSGTVEDGDFIDNLTRYNNTQNAIKVPDFRSNDRVQSKLHRYFATLSRNGKQFNYRHKRFVDKSKNKISIGMEEFHKTIHSYMFGPVDMFGGISYLFDIGQNGGYQKLFGNNVLEEGISLEEFEALAGCWFVCEFARSEMVKERVRLMAIDEEEESSGAINAPIAKPALERRWMLFYVLGELMRAKHSHDLAKINRIHRDLGSPRWMEKNGKEQAAISRYTRYACELLMADYSMARQDVNFMPRNWTRSKETLSRLRYNVRRSSTVLEALPSLA